MRFQFLPLSGRSFEDSCFASAATANCFHSVRMLVLFLPVATPSGDSVSHFLVAESLELFGKVVLGWFDIVHHQHLLEPHRVESVLWVPAAAGSHQ